MPAYGGPETSDARGPRLLTAVLDSWERNDAVLLCLLRALPEGALAVKATADGPSVAELFAQIHSVRLSPVAEDAPEVAVTQPEQEWPEQEWQDERDPALIARRLGESAAAVKHSVGGRLKTGREMNLRYDHPVLMLGHLIWHEGYHHGQIKLALRLAGRPVSDQDAGPGSWSVWMHKTRREGLPDRRPRHSSVIL